MKRLYVIGNGFDIAHGLKTSYWDFRRYLERYAEVFLTIFERTYGFYPYDPEDYHIPKDKQTDVIKRRIETIKNKLWKSFEVSLGNLDESEIYSICDAAAESMKDFEYGGIEDTLNYYFEDQFKFVLELQDYLLKWAKQIRLKNAIVKKTALLYDRIDLFLSFNYTPLLERLYKIDSAQICHIHGGFLPYCNVNPIIGHGNIEVIEQRKQWLKECDDSFDECGASINQAFINFYSRTFKDTSRAICRNLLFFEKMKNIDEVVVIGHSFGSVDLPYFCEIKNGTSQNTLWVIYYHNDSEKNTIEEALNSIGVTNYLTKPSSDFWD